MYCKIFVFFFGVEVFILKNIRLLENVCFLIMHIHNISAGNACVRPVRVNLEIINSLIIL